MGSDLVSGRLESRPSQATARRAAEVSRLNSYLRPLFHVRMNRPASLRTFLSSHLLVALGALMLPSLPAALGADTNHDTLVYFGTYTGKKSKGIYLSRLDPSSGRLTAAEVAAETASPSFLAVHPSGRFVYAVNEISSLNNQSAGGVIGYAIDRATGHLSPLNQQSSGGAGPCHLIVDATGQAVLAANYGGGRVTGLPVAEGRLRPSSSFIQH